MFKTQSLGELLLRMWSVFKVIIMLYGSMAYVVLSVPR